MAPSPELIDRIRGFENKLAGMHRLLDGPPRQLKLPMEAGNNPSDGSRPAAGSRIELPIAGTK